MYNYEEAVRADVKAYIEDNRADILDWLTDNCITLDDTDGVAGFIRDILWACDDVTGNETEYTNYVDDATTKQWVLENIDLAGDALNEFGYDCEHFGRKIAEGDYKYLDTTIRCYLLGGVVEEVIREGGI